MSEWSNNSKIFYFSTRCRRLASFTPRTLYPWEIPTGAPCIEGCVRLRVSLDAVKGEKFLPALGNRAPAVQPINRSYTYWAIYTLRPPNYALFNVFQAENAQNGIHYNLHLNIILNTYAESRENRSLNFWPLKYPRRQGELVQTRPTGTALFSGNLTNCSHSRHTHVCALTSHHHHHGHLTYFSDYHTCSRATF
jgi:hypothetical protein